MLCLTRCAVWIAVQRIQHYENIELKPLRNHLALLSYNEPKHVADY